MMLLRLNPMRSNAERVISIAVAETREPLMQVLERERVEPYSDGPWHKAFRKDGPLEWYNPPDPDMCTFINTPAIVDIGTRADWMEQGGRDFDRLVEGLLRVT
jgi:hypothetical protein